MLKASRNVKRIVAPPIDKIRRLIEAKEDTGAKVIRLGQAVPDFAPHPMILEAVKKALTEPWMHVYSADPGLPALRKALAAKLDAFNGIEVDGASEVLICAGASQAFWLALMTIAEPGAEVIVPTPYYFDHPFAVWGMGCEVVEVPLREGPIHAAGNPEKSEEENRNEEGGVQLTASPRVAFGLDVEAILAAVTERTAIIDLVSPNNPTGAVFLREDLEALAEGLTGTDIAVISDETYDHFVHDGVHISPASLPAFDGRVITIGGFGKAYGLTGWRVGYLAAPAHLVQEMLKLQDTMIICAPVASQVAALAALDLPPSVVEAHRKTLEARRDHLHERVNALPCLDWRDTPGAFFSFPRLAGPLAEKSSWEAMKILLEGAHVGTLPGSAFGAAGEGHLRISFGNVDIPTLDEAFDRMEKMSY